jgi:hypothetical protein
LFYIVVWRLTGHGVYFILLQLIVGLVAVLMTAMCSGTASRHLSAAAAARHRIVHEDWSNEFAGLVAPSSQRAKRAKEAAACHDFNADRAAGRTSKVYDINGIVSIFCRQVLNV